MNLIFKFEHTRMWLLIYTCHVCVSKFCLHGIKSWLCHEKTKFWRATIVHLVWQDSVEFAHFELPQISIDIRIIMTLFIVSLEKKNRKKNFGLKIHIPCLLRNINSLRDYEIQNILDFLVWIEDILPQFQKKKKREGEG